MIIVTGTRRSGTSLWMQILRYIGYRIVGEKFPANWEEIMKKANPKGFFESKLIKGINYHSNPDPQTGAWLSPAEVENIAVKIFAEGIIKTDFAYINKVIVTMRNWQDCESSTSRFKQLKNDSFGDVGTDVNHKMNRSLPAGYNWWKSNFSVLRDIQVRRYPATIISYDTLLEQPENTIASILGWLGTDDTNLQQAVSAVDRSLQTQKNSQLINVNHDYSEIFDELFDTLTRNIKITKPFFDKLVETDIKITQEVMELN